MYAAYKKGECKIKEVILVVIDMNEQNYKSHQS